MDKMNVFRMGYFYDVDTNTLHMTKAFERKTLQYGSDEFRLIRKLREVCPDMKTEIHTRDGKAKPLAYEMMKKFIRLLPTSEADLKEMERQQKMSVAYKSPYKFMERWFNDKYPHHKKLLVKNENGETEWDVLSLLAQGKQEEVGGSNVVEMHNKSEPDRNQPASA